MARVVFWSPENNMTGSTHATIAVSTLMSVVHKTTSLLMQGNFNSKTIEASFTPYDELKNSGALTNSNIGVSALIRLVTSNKLTADAIQNYAKPILKGRLDVLYGMNSAEVEDYKQLVNNLPYITRKAAEVYDLVFVDLPKAADEKFILDTLADSEIVVCVVNQDVIKLDQFFANIDSIEQLKDKTKIYVIGDYESKSKFNIMNIKTKYRIKEPIFSIPHNFIFSDACNSGNVVDFFYRNINTDLHDYNGIFIKETLNIVEKIMEITKIKDN
ncbi:MAG: hypothetical protein RSB76_02730 [Clostridia bacterium]